MNIIHNSLFKIDLETKTISSLPHDDSGRDLSSYVIELLDNILASSDKKGFEFESETTEVRRLLQEIVEDKSNNAKFFSRNTTAIAQRFLLKETEAQERVNKLKIKLQKGILVISLVTFDNGIVKTIISKADHDEFLDSISFEKRSGLPLKKKIYKAFIVEYNNEFEIKTTSVYDTNSSFSVYWWRDFLELKEVFTKEYNTEKAFDIIESKILAPLKKDSKSDYINLWNATVHYFRCKNEFSLEEYNETVIKNYRPFNIS